VANAFTDKLDAIVADAAVASAAVGTIVSGSDAVVDNFAGLKDLVDELSAFASLMKSNTFYAPVGGIIPFAGTTAPGGWLLCDGTGYATTGTYADLFGVIGTAYGSSGGFQVPDLRGRVIAGIDNMGGTDAGRLSLSNTMGTAGGAETLPAHTHPWSTTGGTHAHNYSRPYFGGVDNTYVGGAGTNAYVTSASGGWSYGGWVTSNVGGDGSHSHSGTTDPTGTGTHGVVQPTMVLNYIIKW